MFELNHFYNFVTDAKTALVSESGQIEIIRVLERATRMTLGGWLQDHYFDWRLKDDRNTRFATRIKKHLYKTYNYTMSEELLAQVGKLAADYTASDSYAVRFTDNLDWKAGKFGDGNSCFFGGRTDARQMMYHNGFYAVQVFAPDKKKGIARAWVYPHVEGYEPQEALIVFNGYGLQTRAVTNIIAQLFGYKFSKISLRNNGSYDDILWINDGGNGFVLYPKEEEKARIDRYDFEIPNPRVCEGSGKKMFRRNEWIEIGGYIYAKEWAEANLEKCSHCGNLTNHRDQTRIFSNEKDYVSYCSKCVQSKLRNQEAFVCQFDNKRYTASCRGIEIAPNLFVAEHNSSQYFWCNGCQKYHLKSASGATMSKISNVMLCAKCAYNEQVNIRRVKFAEDYAPELTNESFKAYLKWRQPRSYKIIYELKGHMPEYLLRQLIDDWRGILAQFESRDVSMEDIIEELSTSREWVAVRPPSTESISAIFSQVLGG